MVRLWTTLWGHRLSLRLASSPRASTSLSTSSSSTHSTYSTSSSTTLPTQPGHELGSSAQEKQKRPAVLKTPKGMRDSDPHRMSLVSRVLNTAISCFRRHGAQAMDTPLLERKDILVGHYGEEARLIYELQHQGGEQLVLRYDLTVPFARYLASGRVSRMKRYQVGRVYRRDNPSLAQGRLREFWQCDFDIAGHYEAMVPDAECIRVIHELLTELNVGEFTIRVSERRLLAAVLTVCGLPASLIAGATSAIDKLDKLSWASVREELVSVRGVDSAVVDRVGDYVRRSGGGELVDSLMDDSALRSTPGAELALRDLQLLMKYLEIMGVAHRVVLDLSLARGLDYYTGLIYEAALHNTHSGGTLGSVAAGGRYDNLVSSLSRFSLPCVGLSLGLERLVAAISESQAAPRPSPTEVVVASAEKGFLEHRVELLAQLWDANIKADTLYTRDPRLLAQLRRCEEEAVPLAVIVGGREVAVGSVTLRDVATRAQVEVPRGDLIAEIKRRLANRDPSHATPRDPS